MEKTGTLITLLYTSRVFEREARRSFLLFHCSICALLFHCFLPPPSKD